MRDLNCIIVEDEPLAAKVLEDYIGQTPGLQLNGICEDVFGAMKVLKESKQDVIFLDINLPKINGLDFIKTLNADYSIILTTAYHQYAVEGFNLDVMDYLLKPVTMERFLKAVNKTMDYHLLKEKSLNQQEINAGYFFVKNESKLEKINYADILLIESLANYVVIHTGSRKIVTYSTLKNVESHLPPTKFIKVQKSYIVSIDKIDHIEAGDIIIGKHRIPISRSGKEEILEAILAKKVLRR